MIREIFTCIFLLAGSLAMLLATIGVVRFRDTLCRSHALTKATTFGVSLLLVALWIALGDDIAGLKILLVVSFCLLTIPLASHLVASLYYRQLHEVEKKREENEKEHAGGKPVV
jgi:multicomponent Na+:H+ antiporter subunit G